MHAFNSRGVRGTPQNRTYATEPMNVSTRVGTAAEDEEGEEKEGVSVVSVPLLLPNRSMSRTLGFSDNFALSVTVTEGNDDATGADADDTEAALLSSSASAAAAAVEVVASGTGTTAAVAVDASRRMAAGEGGGGGGGKSAGARADDLCGGGGTRGGGSDRPASMALAGTVATGAGAATVEVDKEAVPDGGVLDCCRAVDGVTALRPVPLMLVLMLLLLVLGTCDVPYLGASGPEATHTPFTYSRTCTLVVYLIRAVTESGSEEGREGENDVDVVDCVAKEGRVGDGGDGDNDDDNEVEVVSRGGVDVPINNGDAALNPKPIAPAVVVGVDDGATVGDGERRPIRGGSEDDAAAVADASTPPPYAAAGAASIVVVVMYSAAAGCTLSSGTIAPGSEYATTATCAHESGSTTPRADCT